MVVRPRDILFPPFFAWLLMVAGCGQNATDAPTDVGTTSAIVLPESNPPVLSKKVVDSIRVGMPQEEALTILQDAAQDISSAKSSVETAVTQGKLNDIRYDLTVTQGKRKMVLAFRDKKLTDKRQEGLE